MVYEYDNYIACAPFTKRGRARLTERGCYKNFPGERMEVAVERGVDNFEPIK